MIRLNKGSNTIIYTPIKEEDNYSLRLISQSINKVINDLELENTSHWRNRFSSSFIYIPDITEDLIIDEDTTLLENTYYFINNSLIIEAGVTLTIPESTYIIFADGVDYQPHGSVIGSDNIEESEIEFSAYSSYNFNSTLFLINWDRGFYWYDIYEDEIVYENGILLLIEPGPDNVIYTRDEDDTIIYNK